MLSDVLVGDVPSSGFKVSSRRVSFCLPPPELLGKRSFGRVTEEAKRPKIRKSGLQSPPSVSSHLAHPQAVLRLFRACAGSWGRGLLVLLWVWSSGMLLGLGSGWIPAWSSWRRAGGASCVSGMLESRALHQGLVFPEGFLVVWCWFGVLLLLILLLLQACFPAVPLGRSCCPTAHTMLGWEMQGGFQDSIWDQAPHALRSRAGGVVPPLSCLQVLPPAPSSSSPP